MSDLDRLRQEYIDRERRFAQDDRYSLSNVAYRYMKAQLNLNIQALLVSHGRAALSDYHVLEVGCGSGNILMDFHQLGVKEENLFGVDLLPNRLYQAHTSHPLFTLACSDGQHLPFSGQSFDLVMQFTAFSSILDAKIRKNVAAEMSRVVKSAGLILSYDFWINPTNPQTVGIRPTEIKHLFPQCRYDFRLITLAPPLARKLVPLSWKVCLLLESLKIFNTHYLVAISKIP